MASHPVLKNRDNDDAATNDICRIMAGWSLNASSSRTQAHQFRLQSCFALIGFGAVSSTIFIDNGSLLLGVLNLMAIIVISLLLNSYYFKDEYAWDATCRDIDSRSSKIATIGLKSYIALGGQIDRPDKLYDHYRNEKNKVSRYDFTTKMLCAVGLVVGISIGTLAGKEFVEIKFRNDPKTTGQEEPP